MRCRDVVLVLEPFSDGELGPEKILEVEQHVAECATCAQRLQLNRALRLSLRRTVRQTSEPSDAFRQRLASALDAAREREWETRAVERHVEKGRMLPWRTILPMAAAAALTLVWAGSTPKKQYAGGEQRHIEASLEKGVDQMLEELVDHHERGRPEVTEPTLLPGFEREVGVPVTIPSFAQYGGRWEGGSVVPIRHERAASLRYKLSGHRLTLYVYDAARFPVEKIEQRLQPRLVGDEAVYVGTRRGYSIGATGRGRVGYAVASDFNDRETAELVASIF